MASTDYNSYAERLSAAFARGRRGYVRSENAFWGYLRTHGANDRAATVGVWTVRALLAVGVICTLPLLGTVLYYVASTLIVVALVWGVIYIIRNGVEVQLPPPPKPPEWRYGFHGFGLYHESGARLDPHDPNDPNDDL